MNKLHMMAVYLIHVWNSKGRGISLPIIRWMLHLWKCLAVNLACPQASVENHLVTEQVLGTQPSAPCRLGWGMASSSLSLLQRSTEIIKNPASFFLTYKNNHLYAAHMPLWGWKDQQFWVINIWRWIWTPKSVEIQYRNYLGRFLTEI